MNFFEEICKGVDPEAFADDLWQHPDRAEAERLYERQQRITEGLQTALGKLSDHFKIVETPVPSYDGDYYEIDGYGEGKSGALYLNEKRLGSFLVKLLQMGGGICSLSPLNANYKDSHVSAIVKLHPSRKEEFETATGLTLREPSVFVPA